MAEFRIDPTGFGWTTGLTLISSEEPVAPSGDFSQQLGFNAADYDMDAEQIAHSIKGLTSLEDTPFTSEMILIEDLGEVEHKCIMREDMTLVYSWAALEAKGDGVCSDDHGHPRADDRDSYPDGFEMA